MKSRRFGDNTEESGVIVLSSNELLLRALEQTLAQSLQLFQVSPEDSVPDILNYLAGQEHPVKLLCLDARLAFKGAPAEPGLAAVYLGQHVRLSERLGMSRLARMLFVLQNPIGYYLSQSPESIFLFSPGCKAISVCNLISSLSHGWRSIEQLNPSELRTRLSPYLLETDSMRQVSAHQYRNLAGIGKLIRELSDDVLGIDHPELASYRRTLDEDLLIKRRSFLSDGRVGDDVCDRQELSQLRNACRGKRFVLIDDEHERGWSTALFSGLFGETTEIDRAKDGPEGTSFGGGRLFCLKSFIGARDFIAVYKRKLESGLQACAEADKWCRGKDQEAKKVAEEQASLQARLRTALKALEPFRVSIPRSQQQLLESRQELTDVARPNLESIADRFTTPTSADDPLAEALAVERPVSELHSALSSYLDRLKCFSDAEAKLKTLEADLQHHQELVEASRERLERAREQQRQADINEQSAVLSLANSFPFSVIFLDLRISPDVNATDVTGIDSSLTLLDSLKEYFPFVPVIVFTASSQVANLAKTKARGADDYWIKQQSSGRELLSAVLKGLERNELHGIWLDLQKVKTRSLLTCYRWQNDAKKPISLRLLGKRTVLAV